MCIHKRTFLHQIYNGMHLFRDIKNIGLSRGVTGMERLNKFRIMPSELEVMNPGNRLGFK